MQMRCQQDGPEFGAGGVRQLGAVACLIWVWSMAGLPEKLNKIERFRMLRLFEKKPDVSQRELAEEIWVSVGSANYVVHALIEKGLVKVVNFKAADDKR